MILLFQFNEDEKLIIILQEMKIREMTSSVIGRKDRALYSDWSIGSSPS